MFSENAPAVFGNQAVLSNLPDEFYSIEANGKIPNAYRYPFFMIQAAASSAED